MCVGQQIRRLSIVVAVVFIVSCSIFSRPSDSESTTMIKKPPETRGELESWREHIWDSIVTELKGETDDLLLVDAARAATWSGCDTCGARLIEEYGQEPALQHEIIPTSWPFKDDWPVAGAGVYMHLLVQSRFAHALEVRPNPIGYKRIMDALLLLGMQGFELLATELARHCDYAQSIEIDEEESCSAGVMVLSHCGNTKATNNIVAAKKSDLCLASGLFALAGSKDLREAACSRPLSLALLAEFYPEEARLCALSRLSVDGPLTEWSPLEALPYVDPSSNELLPRIVATLKEREERWECLIPAAAVAGINIDEELQAMRRLSRIDSCMTKSLISLARSKQQEHWDLLLKMSQSKQSLLAKYAFDASATAARDERLLAEIVKSTFTSRNASGLTQIYLDHAETIYLRFVQTADIDVVIETFKPFLNNNKTFETEHLQGLGLLALSTLHDPRVAQIMTEATTSEWPTSRIIGKISLWAYYEKKLSS